MNDVGFVLPTSRIINKTSPPQTIHELLLYINAVLLHAALFYAAFLSSNSVVYLRSAYPMSVCLSACLCVLSPYFLLVSTTALTTPSCFLCYYSSSLHPFFYSLRHPFPPTEYLVSFPPYPPNPARPLPPLPSCWWPASLSGATRCSPLLSLLSPPSSGGCYYTIFLVALPPPHYLAALSLSPQDSTPSSPFSSRSVFSIFIRARNWQV